MKPLVLFDAAAFCYGPASTLDAVLAELWQANIEIAVLVSGTSAEFLSPHLDRCDFIDCDTDDPAALARHDALFRQCKLFVSNTNPLSARHALLLGARTLYLDTLFWMWDEIDPVIADSAIYVAQDFDGVADNRRRIGHAINDFHVVGPLIREAVDTGVRSDTCVISYGGMTSMLIGFDAAFRYARTMTRLVIGAMDGAPPFARYLFRGNGRIMTELALEFGSADRDFAFVPHADYVEETAGAGLLLLSPGLTGCYEALETGTRTWLLPPQNYSQQLQAAVFLDQPAPVFAGRHWRHIYPDFALPRYLPEEEGVARLSAAIARFEQDAAAQATYGQALRETMIDGSPPTRRRHENEQQRGAAVVANMIRHAVAA